MAVAIWTKGPFGRQPQSRCCGWPVDIPALRSRPEAAATGGAARRGDLRLTGGDGDPFKSRMLARPVGPCLGVR